MTTAPPMCRHFCTARIFANEKKPVFAYEVVTAWLGECCSLGRKLTVAAANLGI